MIRTKGTSIGKYHSGYFRDKITREKYFLFLNGSGTRRCFTYNGVTFVVDFRKNDTQDIKVRIRPTAVS